MAGKTWQPSRKGIRDLNRHIRKGMTLYTVSQQALNAAPWEDAQMWTAHTFDRQSRITGEWMTGHLSVSGLMGQCGTVYEQPPRSMREVGSPGRQVAGPVPQGYSAYLDDAEIRGLEKQVTDGSDPKKRRPLGSWRV